MNEPVQAWYREPWTWMLIGLPATAVLASLASAFLAIEGADPIIENNYYQNGLAINTMLARVHAAATMGIHANVEYDGLHPGQAVWVKVRSAQAVHDPSVLIRLVHPARDGLDLQAILARVPGSPDTDAEYTGRWPDAAVDTGQAGHRSAVNWRIALQGQAWQVEGDLQGRSDIAAR
jgi:hypothetical protein